MDSSTISHRTNCAVTPNHSKPANIYFSLCAFFCNLSMAVLSLELANTTSSFALVVFSLWSRQRHTQCLNNCELLAPSLVHGVLPISLVTISEDALIRFYWFWLIFASVRDAASNFYTSVAFVPFSIRFRRNLDCWTLVRLTNRFQCFNNVRKAATGLNQRRSRTTQ